MPGKPEEQVDRTARDTWWGHLLSRTRQAAKKASIWHQQGLEFAQVGNYGEAVTRYVEALNRDPQRAGVWYDLGEAQRQLYHWPEALSAYDQALHLNARLA
jgi:tetratricopeptide (TPR) repeat protein